MGFIYFSPFTVSYVIEFGFILCISRIISHNQLLSVYLSNYPTHAQRKTLCELADSGYYDHFNFDCVVINDDRNALLRKLRLVLHMPI